MVKVCWLRPGVCSTQQWAENAFARSWNLRRKRWRMRKSSPSCSYQGWIQVRTSFTSQLWCRYSVPVYFNWSSKMPLSCAFHSLCEIPAFCGGLLKWLTSIWVAPLLTWKTDVFEVQYPQHIWNCIFCVCRHIDTAGMYGNEDAVGRGIKAVDRKDVFITSKLRNEDHGRVEEAVKEQLKTLQTDYIDLYLVTISPCRSSLQTS